MQLFGLRSIYISDKYVAWHFPFSVDSPLEIFFHYLRPLTFSTHKNNGPTNKNCPSGEAPLGLFEAIIESAFRN
jgi:hypothetical protein